MSTGMKCVVTVLVVVGLLAWAQSAAAQWGGSSHHHHDAYGHRVDDQGHHIDRHGHHTGGYGVYDGYSSDTYYGRGYSQSYYPPSNSAPYVVRRPAFEPGLIRICSPASCPGAVRYTLNGYPYTIHPGQAQTIESDRPWVASFDRGHGEVARYSLRPGEYSFGATDDGHWELYRSNAAPAPAPGPAGGPPPNAAPGSNTVPPDAVGNAPRTFAPQ